MTQFPGPLPEPSADVDVKLTRFLRQHRPPTPTAAPDLANRLMARLESLPRRSRDRWMIPTTLAASLIAGWISYCALLPRLQPDPEAANLEAFLDSTWRTPSQDSPDVVGSFVSDALADASAGTDP